MRFYKVLLFFALTIAAQNLQAICWNPFIGPHYIALGPEFEYFTRNCVGRGKMKGFLYGGWASYDRIHPFSLYYGGEGYWVKGKISGKTLTFRTKASHRESDAEGRVGFTFQTSSMRKWTLIPYVGYGYFNGNTQFQPTGSGETANPVPLQLLNTKFRNTFPFYSAGVLSSVCLSKCFTLGLNLKFKYMNGGIQKIHDSTAIEDYQTIYQSMGDKPLYEIDLPLTYNVCVCTRNYYVSLVPFYRYRHYGKKENFPFDCLETKFRSYGGRLTLDFRL